ncbi:MAG: menaquinone biosynthesis protein [Thermodesulfovibrionales bacterium]
MREQPLRIGRIPYLNLFPIFAMLERLTAPGRYVYVEGVPSSVNAMLRQAEIDVSPSSSIEYLRSPGRYEPVRDHSISSFGPIRSILLFSRLPIEDLGSSTVLTTVQSETSVALLEIVFRKFYGIRPRLQPSSGAFEDEMRSQDAYLLIGDDALRREHAEGCRIYDLGDIWYRFTGTPFVFALWLARTDCIRERPLQVERLAEDLDRAKEEALGRLDELAGASPLSGLFSRESLVSYWKGISYDFGESHRAGLSLFERYCRELGIIPSPSPSS